MKTVDISINPRYDDSRIIVRQILRLGNAIKRDVSRIVRLHAGEYSPKTQKLIIRSKQRILQRLSQINEIRHDKKIHNESQWNSILQLALSQVYKHSATSDIHEKIQFLIDIDRLDVSDTGIQFLQMYMRIIARIPDENIILPFKP